MNKTHLVGGQTLRVRVIALCIFINMLDGFDILAMAYAAPLLGKTWAISPGSLGLLFSVGLAGMMLGSMVVGLLADRTGRRPMILVCLALAASGMAAAAISPGLAWLGAARFITGLAIGGMLPCINTMVAEYALPHQRSMAVSLMQAGFAIGASTGGFVSVWLLNSWGWHAVFAFGAILTAALLPLVYLGMPESLAYLARQPLRANERKTLEQQLGEISVIDPASAAAEAKIFSALAPYVAPLMLVFMIWFFCVMSFYFLNSWVPQILSNAGLPESQAVIGGAMLTAGGIFSALALGWLSLRRSILAMLIVCTFGSAVMTALFGQITASAGLLMGAAFILGILTNATQIGIYAVIPSLFPPQVRAGATGLAIGMGRLGSVIGPWLAGLLLASGWGAASLFLLMALPYAGAACLMLGLRQWQRH